MGVKKTIYLSDETFALIQHYRKKKAEKGEFLSFSEAIENLVRRGAI